MLGHRSDKSQSGRVRGVRISLKWNTETQEETVDVHSVTLTELTNGLEYTVQFAPATLAATATGRKNRPEPQSHPFLRCRWLTSASSVCGWRRSARVR